MDDREPQAGPRHLFIEPRPRGECSSQLLGGQAWPVVLDRDRQASLLVAALHRDPPAGPLAGVVHQVAEHLLEVLPLAAEDVIGLDVDRELQIATVMEARQRALDRGDARRHRHARARDVQGGRGPRPSQLVVDLPSHRGDLASHRRGELRGAVGGEPVDLVGQDAERGLQAVRQIAGLDAAPSDDFLVALENRVEIFDERLGLGREPAFEPLDPPFADGRHAGAQAVERSEPDPNLDRNGRDQGQGQDTEGEAERAGERRVRGRQLALVRGGDHPVGPRGIGERHGPFESDEPLPVGALDPSAVGSAASGYVERQGEGDVPQRPRAENRPLRSVDLPVEPGVRLAQSRVGRLMRQEETACIGTLQRGGDLLELRR